MIIIDPLPEPTVIALDAGPAAVIRHEGVTVADLPTLFDVGYQAIAASGAALAGPPFALYHGDPLDTLDLEMGFPLSHPLTSAVPGDPAVLPATVPAGRALALSHFGAYDSLPGGWDRLIVEAQRRGLTWDGFMEVYVTDPTPETDPATLRTDLFLLVDAPA